MANKPKDPAHIEANICGAKVKSRGRSGSGKVCNRAPMSNGRCHLHGGKSTGPKNSLGYYKKQALISQEIADIQNPMDLLGEVALVRTLLQRMEADPLKVKCLECKDWVTAVIKCPHEDIDGTGKNHYVFAKDNDLSKIVGVTKMLSDIVKNHKEIQSGKEVVIRIEVLNFIVQRVITAYEDANIIPDPEQRRSLFVQSIEKLLVEPVEVSAQAVGRNS